VADGITQVVHQQTRTLVKKGYDVTVYTSNALDLHGGKGSKINDSVKYVDGVKVRYFPYILRYGTMFFTPSMFNSIRDEVKEFDVIHIHDARCFQSAVTAYYSQVYNVPIVYQPHGSFKSYSHGGFLRFLSRGFIDKLYAERIFRKANRIIALNQTEAALYRSMGMREEKIEIIPNGIDLTEYSDLPLRGSFKEKYNIPLETPLILYLGRIHKIKGINILVKAFAKVIEKVDNVKLVIVGPDDGYLEEIQVLINNLEIEKNILITGPLYGKEKLEAYVDADVYVLPSIYETFPMSVLEAYSCGKPVIASRVGGLKDLVIDGVTGLLFESENNEQLVESLLSILNNNARAEKMGAKGIEFVEENFTIEKVVDRLEDIYTEAVIT